MHPDAVNSLYRDYTGDEPDDAAFPARGSLVGEPVYLYMYNDTISNSAQGVHINSSQSADTTGETAIKRCCLNNTFYNDAVRHPDARAAVQRHERPVERRACWR